MILLVSLLLAKEPKYKLVWWTLISLAVFSFLFYIASLPTSYEECVLKKMDGRNVKLTSFAIKICRKEFPEVIVDPWEVDEWLPVN